MDIIFLLDTSSSISADDFNSAKIFLNNTVSLLSNDIDSGNVRVSVVTFSTQPHRQVTWSQSTDHLTQAIPGLYYVSGDTETSRALDMVREMFVTMGRRQAVKVSGGTLELSYSLSSYLICPVGWLAVGAPLQILQPASSTPRGSRLSEV